MKARESRVRKWLERARASEVLDTRDLISWLKDAYALLDSSEERIYSFVLATICFIADTQPSDTMVQALLAEVIGKSRVFHYRDMLNRQEKGFTEKNPVSPTEAFARDFYTDATTGTILTKHQKEILKLFHDKRRLVLSAPTSFGKTKILEEIILNEQFERIAIIVPTNALLSENYHRLKNNSEISERYRIVYSSRHGFDSESARGTIFILTPEKLLNLLDENELTFDFFVFDEFYKVSKDFESTEEGDYDRRYKVFEHALYALVQSSTTAFYMIGPYIDSFSKKFLQKHDAYFREYRTEIVQKKIYSQITEVQDVLEVKVVGDPRKNIVRTLDVLVGRQQQNLIYTPKQESAENLSVFYVRNHEAQGDVFNPKNRDLWDLIEHIKKNVSPEWDLVETLKQGVAFHHGGVPRYIQAELVDLFNSGIIHSLFCTTTLAEGVNTTAKNVLFSNVRKSNSSLTSFDRKNIEGRSGRFAEHFVGNVYYLVDAPVQEVKTRVEYELYDSQSLGLEDAILIKDIDLTEESLKKTKRLDDQLEAKNIPRDLLRENRFISIEKQIKVIESLRSASTLPFSEVTRIEDFFKHIWLERLLKQVFLLPNLAGDGRWKGFTEKQLAWLVRVYIRAPSLKTLLANPIVSGAKKPNTRIRRALKIMSQHFEFLLPRYFQAYQRLYNFVAKERLSREIELTPVISLLEYGATNEHSILLRDAGLPIDIVKKIQKQFHGCEDFSSIVRRRFQRESRLRQILSDFEFKMVLRYL